MKTRFKFISFRYAEFPGWWECVNNKSGAVLGTVTFEMPWKCWVFTPDDAIFSADCLRDIAAFQDGLLRYGEDAMRAYATEQKRARR